MKSINHSFIILCFFVLFYTIGCQNRKPSPPELVNIDLLRGDIILCGGNQFGEVSFALSCSYATRDTFNLAVSLLHSFEYLEAEKAFAKVIDKDPDCAMAYWGLAMSILNHPKFGPSQDGFEKASKVLEIAESLPKTEQEQEYLDAILAYYNNDWDNTNHLMRAQDMEKPMEELYLKYKEDKEAAIFYALSLFATADQEDKNYTKQKKAGHILESIFPDQPNHPGIAHYIIHHYDHPELAQIALPTARRYAEIASGSAHAQHMPSHIFTRLGLWDESIQSNLNSASSAQCYAEEVEMDGHWGREVHALDYLVYAYLQKGDNEKAMEQYNYSQTINKIYPSNYSPYNFDAIQVRMVLENKQWVKAAQLKYSYIKPQWEKYPWEKSLLHFARAMGASHTGEINFAEKELDTLKTLHRELENKDDYYRGNQVMVQIKTSEAWINFALGNQEEAIALMLEAVELEEKTGKHPITPGEVLPAPELLGDMLLAMNKSSQALEAYELDLKGHPNRFNGIYGAAIAAKGIGDEQKARMYFEELLKLTKNSNSDRPEVEEARAFVGYKAI